MDVVFEAVVAGAIAVGAWVLLPTLRTFVHRDFGPTHRDLVSVFYAQQSSHP